MVLGKLLVPGRPTNLDESRARAYCACSRRGWGLFVLFSLVYHFSNLSPSLRETALYRLKYCLKGPLSPKPVFAIIQKDAFGIEHKVFCKCTCLPIRTNVGCGPITYVKKKFKEIKCLSENTLYVDPLAGSCQRDIGPVICSVASPPGGRGHSHLRAAILEYVWPLMARYTFADWLHVLIRE